jgi:toxin CcdB
MARFDVYAPPGSSAFLLDCQSDVLAMLTTRLVVPLLPPGEGPLPISRLNPTFQVEGQPVVMYTQWAASVPKQELTNPLSSLAEEDRAIINAFDMLLTGY